MSYQLLLTMHMSEVNVLLSSHLVAADTVRLPLLLNYMLCRLAVPKTQLYMVLHCLVRVLRVNSVSLLGQGVAADVLCSGYSAARVLGMRPGAKIMQK